MDVQENSYLLFFSAGFHFLLPLRWVDRVMDVSKCDQELPVTDFAGWREDTGLSGQSYLILADCGDRKLGMKAESVSGLVYVEGKQIYALPEAVKSDENRYVDGMAMVDAAEGEGRMAYVVNPLLIVPSLSTP